MPLCQPNRGKLRMVSHEWRMPWRRSSSGAKLIEAIINSDGRRKTSLDQAHLDEANLSKAYLDGLAALVHHFSVQISPEHLNTTFLSACDFLGAMGLPREQIDLAPGTPESQRVSCLVPSCALLGAVRSTTTWWAIRRSTFNAHARD